MEAKLENDKTCILGNIFLKILVFPILFLGAGFRHQHHVHVRYAGRKPEISLRVWRAGSGSRVYMQISYEKGGEE